jgi:hypothetical protein
VVPAAATPAARGGEGRDGEEEEEGEVGVFGVHFAGDAVEKWLGDVS